MIITNHIHMWQMLIYACSYLLSVCERPKFWVEEATVQSACRYMTARVNKNMQVNVWLTFRLIVVLTFTWMTTFKCIKFLYSPYLSLILIKWKQKFFPKDLQVVIFFSLLIHLVNTGNMMPDWIARFKWNQSECRWLL